MTVKELFDLHHQKKCEKCKSKENCEGIYITINGSTKCQKCEVKNES